MTESTPVFIVGAQRSGTTLLRLLLNAHSQLAIPEEGTFWIPLLRRMRRDLERPIAGEELGRALDYVARNHQFRLWGIDPEPHFAALRRAGRTTLAELMAGTYLVYARAHEKRAWGEKSSVFFRMIPLLAALFPGARFVHMIRDGRDVFASWRKMDRTKDNAAVGAVEWAYKIRKARRDLAPLGAARGMEVRYESLVAEPRPVLEGVCRFLELAYEPGMLEFHRSSDRFIGAHHSDLIFNPVSTRSVNNWKKDLTPREVRAFDLLAGDELASLGYEVTTRRPDPAGLLLGAYPQLAIGLPARAAQVLWTALDLDLSSRLGRATRAAGGGEPPPAKGAGENSAGAHRAPV